ncbi:MAG: methyltransferase domain-containing protein [Dehalococcoidia bacterium]|nr:methyltransferase domain-containing protein [Dehalococcoidia bacterium]
MESAERYRAMVEAANAQSARLRGPIDAEARWDRMANRFRLDPRRQLDANMQAIAEYVEPGDVVLDVGGGAGRVSLPLALRCREVVNVEPSHAMAREFRESATEAGITNARVVEAGWMEADVDGDLAIVANVTYFMADIAGFIEKLNRDIARRVIISVWSVPPPMRNAPVFAVAYGEPQARCPGHRELLDVLWEMGLLPDVRVLPEPFMRHPSRSREAAIQGWLNDATPPNPDECRTRLEARFEQLFEEMNGGYVVRRDLPTREMLITWETR